ncbi:MAG: GGDEF domain-containing protein [Herminiimonas sp.]|nr:GGDEF domain-containing protein [Herminiimonas sp.]
MTDFRCANYVIEPQSHRALEEYVLRMPDSRMPGSIEYAQYAGLPEPVVTAPGTWQETWGSCTNFNDGGSLPDHQQVDVRDRDYLAVQLENDIAVCLRRYYHWLAHRNEEPPLESDLIFFLLVFDDLTVLRKMQSPGAGESILQQMRQTLQNGCRESDYLVQWNGAEILAVARGTHRTHAESLAERMRATIASHRFLLADGSMISGTCSLGFACFPYIPSYPGLLTWSQVINIARHCLQRAMESGQNGWTGMHGTERTTSDRGTHDILKSSGEGTAHTQPYQFS